MPAAGVSGQDDNRLVALMLAAQAGDGASYAALLRGCVPIAAAVARRQGVHADRVDDVVQDVLLTVHRARATYDPARPFLPWLYAIAQRRAVDALRAHGRRGGREVHDEAAYLDRADEASDAETLLDREADRRRLLDAITNLPDAQRQAIEQMGLRERSLEEAARDTGRSKVALKVNMHRALRALRVMLAGDGND